MKILNLLELDDFQFNGSVTPSENSDNATGFKAPAISVSDLNSLQLRTLNRLKTNTIDLEHASDKELGIIMDLIDIGLVDSDGNVTDAGREAADPPNFNVDIRGQTPTPSVEAGTDDADFGIEDEYEGDYDDFNYPSGDALLNRK